MPGTGENDLTGIRSPGRLGYFQGYNLSAGRYKYGTDLVEKKVYASTCQKHN
jgi:hypothetical protein